MTIEYIPDTVTITATVDPDDYDAGDWATVCGALSPAAVDYNDPMDGKRIDLGGLGTGDPVAVTMTVAVDTPGLWTFGVATYDAIGNQHDGTPGEAAVYVALTPRAPDPLEVVSYDDVAGILKLQ